MDILRKNTKGQAAVELVFLITLLITIFCAMIVFGVYIYDRMVLMYAVNLGINESVGLFPNKDVPDREINEKAKRKVAEVLARGIFMKDYEVSVKAKRKPNNTAEVMVGVKAKVDMSLPFVENLIPKDPIWHTGKEEYAW